jgi:hypothetical protein
MTRSPGSARPGHGPPDRARTGHGHPWHSIRLALGGWLTDRRNRGAARRHGRTGSEPATARSDLRMRFLLAGTAAPLYLLGAVGFALWAVLAPRGHPPDGLLWGFTALCAVLSLTAAVDLLFVRRRRDEQRRWGRWPPPR